MRIHYQQHARGIRKEHLEGFFVGWGRRPSPATHLELLRRSDHVVVAIDEEKSRRVVGFITALSDRVLCAYIPLLEVLPAYQGQGIGRELVERMLVLLKDHYMIDLVCDPHLQEFYEHHGLRPHHAMIIRKPSNIP